MNLIYIGTDTWRADHLGCYGADGVRTPNIDRLASESVRFSNTYSEALPTIPMRRAVFTGKHTLPCEPIPRGKRFPPKSKTVKHCPGWGPLHRKDVTFADVLSPTDYQTALICDCYHFFQADMNYHMGFKSWEWIRGQEIDAWRTGPKAAVDLSKHIPAHLRSDWGDRCVMQHCLNFLDAATIEQRPIARTVRAATRWLEHNAPQGPFALWVEMFDPHEPWNPPQRFRDMYDAHHPECEQFIFAYHLPVENLRPDEIALLKRMYAASVSFADMMIGRLLDAIRDMGLLDDTMIVFTTDHGTHLGEEGCIQKQHRFLNRMVTHIPLLVRHPDTARFGGLTVDGLVSAPDIVPTILDVMGQAKPECMTGSSAWPMVVGAESKINERVFSAFFDYAAVRDENWRYFRRLVPGGGDPPSPCLYDQKKDPNETVNVIQDHPDIVAELDKCLAQKFEVKL